MGNVLKNSLFGVSVLAAIISPVQVQAQSVPENSLDQSASNRSASSDSASTKDSASQKLEDIVVTAERTDTKLQKTPVADTAFTSRQIERLGIENIRDLEARAPNVYLPPETSGATSQTYSLRGFGNTDIIGDPTVGVYIDDVYIPRSVGVLENLPDLDEVEILRGPQGTLYGRNSIGGAIKFNTYEPSDYLGGYVSTTVGNYGKFEPKFYLTGALVPDVVSASIAVDHDQHEGYVYDPVTNGKVNNLDTTNVRAKLKITPSDKLEVLFTVDGSSDRSTSTNFISKNYVNGQFNPAGLIFNPYTTYEAYTPPEDLEGGGVSARVKYKIDPHLTFTSITSDRSMKGPLYSLASGLPTVDEGWTKLVIDDRDLTQEFQLTGNYDRFKFNAGLFYLHEDFAVDLDSPYTASTKTPTSYQGEEGTDSYAIYGQGTYSITNQLSFILGARFTYERRSLDENGYSTDASFDPVSQFLHANSAISYNNFSPKVGLQYQWTSDLMTYVSYSKGFLAGGYSLRSTSAILVETPYKPETVSTYELGFKGDFLQHRLRTNVALFYNDIKDMQVVALNTNLNPPIAMTTNAATGHSEGVEVEISAEPINGLTLGANASYLSTDYSSFPNAFAIGQGAAGKEFPFAPKWTASASASYQLPLRIPGKVRVSADATYQSQVFLDIANTEAIASPPEFFVNASIQYVSQDKHWVITGAVRNIFNRTYQVFGYDVASSTYAYNPWYSADFTPPRTFEATVRYNF
jgi:iron complex outermembrane recepter protein